MTAPGERGEGPRRLGEAIERVVARDAPRTLLAEVQTVWARACGERIAAAAEPVSERRGVITIACETGAWAQELELMQEALLTRLEGEIGEGRVERLRFTADRRRHR